MGGDVLATYAHDRSKASAHRVSGVAGTSLPRRAVTAPGLCQSNETGRCGVQVVRAPAGRIEGWNVRVVQITCGVNIATMLCFIGIRTFLMIMSISRWASRPMRYHQHCKHEQVDPASRPIASAPICIRTRTHTEVLPS